MTTATAHEGETEVTPDMIVGESRARRRPRLARGTVELSGGFVVRVDDFAGTIGFARLGGTP